MKLGQNVHFCKYNCGSCVCRALEFAKHFCKLGLSHPHCRPPARQGKADHFHCAESETAHRGELDAQGHRLEAQSGLEPRPQSPFSRRVLNTYHVPGPVLGFRDTGMNQKSTWLLGNKAQQNSQE